MKRGCLYERLACKVAKDLMNGFKVEMCQRVCVCVCVYVYVYVCVCVLRERERRG